MRKLPPFLAKLQEVDNEFFNCIEKTQSISMKPGSISTKHKMLILLAVDAYAGSTGVKGIAEMARREGATDDEIREALRIAVSVATNKTINTSLNAF